MNEPLLLTTLGLLGVLVAIERLAASALCRQQASWHAHYARVPATATITAEFRWNCVTWVTAYVDDLSDRPGMLQLAASLPLSSRDQATCLRWLRTEGFADAAICGAGDQRERSDGEHGT
ncbi:hypothetical protein AYO41_03735 [Verrucomicrobia bacterium SCGC AG-212-E04]|nr:hypothetical protein AYO41_03735 [Verrucomicrobia bacterium SCGC AG-212-E04]